MFLLEIFFTLLLIGEFFYSSIYINRIIILHIVSLLLILIIIININTIKNIIEIHIYSNLYKINNLELLTKILLYIGAIILNTLGEIKNKLNLREFILFTFICVFGMITLTESINLISMYLSIELISFPLYIISSLFNKNINGLGVNKNNQSGIKSGLKYLLLGSFTNTLLLAGIGIIYFESGLTNLDEIGIFINTGISKDFNIWGILQLINHNTLTAYILILSALLFKIGAVPFHNWAPDVYDGVPTIVTSWISILPKISFIIMIGILNTSVFLYIPNSNYIFIFTSFGSLIIGSILGLSQYRIKRLLTYSSIAQTGFILLGYSIIESSSIESIFFYLTQYSLTSICIFLILMSINKSFNIEIINQFICLFTSNPLIGISLMICFFSFAGIPPFIGFFGKLDILYQSIHFNYYFLSFIAIITSIITASYYLRIIKISQFDFSKLFENIYNYDSNGNISINTFISILTSLIFFYILLFDINLNDIGFFIFRLFPF